MDYRKADQIKRKSLIDLINEKNLEEGEGIFKSIGRSISEKLQSKVTRIGRFFNPLRLVSALTPGSQKQGNRGIFTRVARAFGASDENIEYYGGYGRKDKSKRTKIGPGQVRNLEVGDSSADILAKIYNFMLKDYERQKLQRELDENFQKEQQEENERRHKKLVEEIEKLKGGKVEDKPKVEEKKQDNFLETVGKTFKKIIGTIKGLALTVIPAIGFLIGMFKKVISPLESMGTRIIEGIMGSLFNLVEPIVSFLLKGTAKTILSKVADAILKVVGFIGELTYDVLKKGLQGASRLLGARVLAGLGIGAAVVGGVVSYKAIEEGTDELQSAAFTSDRPGGPRDQAIAAAKERDKKLSDYEKEYASTKVLVGKNDDYSANIQKIQNEYLQKMGDIQGKQNIYFDEYIRPILESKGYHVSDKPYDYAPGFKAGNGLKIPRITDSNGEELNVLQYNLLALSTLAGREAAKEEKEISANIKTFIGKELDKAKEGISKDSTTSTLKNEISSAVTDVEKSIKNFQINLEKMEEDDTEEQGTTIINQNDNKVIGGKQSINDTRPIPARIQNDTVMLALNRVSVAV